MPVDIARVRDPGLRDEGSEKHDEALSARGLLANVGILALAYMVAGQCPGKGKELT